MRNNFFVFLILFLTLNQFAVADQFKFETKEIEIIDSGNLILAKDGTAKSDDEKLEIEAKEFQFNKISNSLKAFNGNALIKSNNLKIQFDEIEFDQNNLTIYSEKKVKIFDLKKNYVIETDKIFYDRNKNILNSSSSSILKDGNNNTLVTDSFEFKKNENLIKINNAKLTDFDENIFHVNIGYIDTLTNTLIGKDLNLDLNNKSFNKNNEPRMKGKSVEKNNFFTKVTKGVFTTCKKRDGCPPWQLFAEKIQHDKEKKVINYKNAVLKVYDLPVMYFPKFFHPDPTVNRRSGFLIPTIKNSPNSDNFLSVPYYSVLGMNKDITFTPRLYTEDKLLLQSEYRHVNKDSTHISDFGILSEKDKNSKSHFFYEYNKNLNYFSFEESNLDLQIQQTSNDTYLKANKIETVLTEEDNDVLQSSIGLNLYSEDLAVDTEFIVYENLNKDKSDRYEFILPKIKLLKNIENRTNLNGDFNLKSNSFMKNYNTNVFETVNINDLIFNSNPVITKNGFYNNYDFILKNVNSDSRNSNEYKKDNHYLSGLLQFNSSIPLIKETKNYRNIIKPKASLKISPNNNTKNISGNVNRLDVNNIYNLNRISSNDTIEGGLSLAYGNEFLISNKENSEEIFSLKLANNLRFTENQDLPKNNQMGAKTSNFLAEIMFSPNEIFTTKYITSTKNNFYDVNYENFLTEIKINNFVTTFDYINENDTKDKNSYLLSSAKYLFNESNSISFSTRENKKTDLTEYYKFMYQYKNDCLSASIVYNKDYYNDRDVKPEESIFLKLTIIPLGETSSPDLKN
tara:strand:- start:2789 stop:5173 length:2385 start_codon:yes stop_codon:yes gene_type:complete